MYMPTHCRSDEITGCGVNDLALGTVSVNIEKTK